MKPKYGEKAKLCDLDTDKFIVYIKTRHLVNMLYYDRNDVSRGIDLNKTSTSKTCITFHYWYILYKGFRFQPTVCNGCHNVLMIP